MTRFRNVLYHWIPIAFTIIIVSGFSYVAVQQNYRISLNDPQIAMAEDAKTLLLNGGVPADVVPPTRAVLFDAGKSLAPFIAVYDSNGTPLEADAFIDNAPPKPPAGVFVSAKANGEDRVTWQPDANTRIALVVVSVGNAKGYFVAAGRNMREVESREDNLTKMFALTLILGLIVSFILDFLGDSWRRRMVDSQVVQGTDV